MKINAKLNVECFMPRIMLIEDDRFTREDLNFVLTDAGYEVFTFSGGRDALAAADSAKPHFVVTDIVMEDGEGIGVLTTLSERFPEVVSIAISSNRNYLKYAANLGASHTLLKPFKADQLLSLLSSVPAECEV
jgi:DNA-binding NtrC family response regulator